MAFPVQQPACFIVVTSWASTHKQNYSSTRRKKLIWDSSFKPLQENVQHFQFCTTAFKVGINKNVFCLLNHTASAIIYDYGY